jgi:hypothetical protein
LCSDATACNTTPIGQLRKNAGRYEFSCPEYGLIVRGIYLEWVLEAAAEVIAKTEQLKANGRIEEMLILAEFGETDGASEADVESARYAAKNRFGAVPQCIVSMGDNDYRWIQRDGRPDSDSSHVERLLDHSLTRKPGEWLIDEPS